MMETRLIFQINKPHTAVRILLVSSFLYKAGHVLIVIATLPMHLHFAPRLFNNADRTITFKLEEFKILLKKSWYKIWVKVIHVCILWKLLKEGLLFMYLTNQMWIHQKYWLTILNSLGLTLIWVLIFSQIFMIHLQINLFLHSQIQLDLLLIQILLMLEIKV